MKTFILTILTMLVTVSFSFSQTEEATTKAGKKVMLHSDGTWKYAEESKSTVSTTSSDCADYVVTTEDKMTGDKTTSAKNKIVVSTDGGKNGFGIYLLLGSRSLIMTIQAVGAGRCIDEGSKINILFTDGSKMELASEEDFNCKGSVTVYFGGVFGKKKQLEELKAKKIQAMRVWTTDGFVEKEFTADNSEEFYHTINCLTNN